ncbi:hypothetical protein JL720_5143 [Aureococcus anophagefferens]|nr:hypothetical protein JL720_5143 [Aureococcus anophagefferens]
MSNIRIVERDADGKVTKTFHDSSMSQDFKDGGYSGARKAFAAKKFDGSYELPKDHTLALLVGEVAKLVHPEPKKGKKASGTPKAKKAAAPKKEATADKKAAKNAKVEEKPKGASEVGWTPPAEEAENVAPSPPKKTCAPSMLLSMPMKSGAPPKELPKKEPDFDPYAESPGKKKQAAKKRKQVVVEESDDESLPVQGAGDDADSEEEFDFVAEEEDAEEEDDEQPAAPDRVDGACHSIARTWSAFAETVVAPDAGDARGDEWSPVADQATACEAVSVVKALGPKDLASRFYDTGLLTLESAKWALGPETLGTVQNAVAEHYGAKLEEARAERITLKGKGKDHKLKPGEEETLDGFNQRPGGRVDMVLDSLPEVVAAGANWPWAPVATGCTEFVPTSHFASRGADAKFKNVSHMKRARHYVHAGTPLVMDYRLWHRGLPNTGTKDRYLLYAVYQTAKGKRALEDTGGDLVALGQRKFLRAE